MSRFTHILVVSPLADGNTWALMREFGYRREIDGAEEPIDIPEGFLTDFASVPPFAQWLIPKWGKYGNPAVVHDWLYWKQTKSRRYADETLLDAMNVTGVDFVRKYAIYWAVRCFGWWAWMRNAEDRVSGFDRVLPSSQLTQGMTSARVGAVRQVFGAFKKRFHHGG